MENLILKLIISFGVFLVGIMGGMLPMYIHQKNDSLLSILNVGSGGVILAAGMLHLLPDASEALRETEDSIKFPLSNLLCASGFLVLLFIDQIASEFNTIAESEESAATVHVRFAAALVSAQSFLLIYF